MTNNNQDILDKLDIGSELSMGVFTEDRVGERGRDYDKRDKSDRGRRAEMIESLEDSVETVGEVSDIYGESGIINGE